MTDPAPKKSPVAMDQLQVAGLQEAAERRAALAKLEKAIAPRPSPVAMDAQQINDLKEAAAKRARGPQA